MMQLLKKSFRSDPLMQYGYGISFLLCCASGFAFVQYLPRSVRIPLHYNVYFGIDFIGNWQQALLLPFAGFILIMMNMALGFFVWRRDVIVSRLIAIATLLIIMFVSISSFLILLINV